MMLNFVRYLDGNKHSGSQFELLTQSRLFFVNINRKVNSEVIAQYLYPSTKYSFRVMKKT